MRHKCSYCGKEFKDPGHAYECFQKHDLVLVPFTREELISLIRFIQTADYGTLAENVIDRILFYKNYNPKSNK